MSLSPYSRRSHKEEASSTDSAELVACEKCRLGECSSKVNSQRHAISSKQWTRRFCQYRGKADDAENYVAPPNGPILEPSQPPSLSQVASLFAKEKGDLPTNGSSGESDGCGTRIIFPVLSRFECVSRSAATAFLLASSSTLTVPGTCWRVLSSSTPRPMTAGR